MTFEIGKLLAASTVAGAMMASAAMAETELRMMWYNDGNEGSNAIASGPLRSREPGYLGQA